jgi:hypothetical protein
MVVGVPRSLSLHCTRARAPSPNHTPIEEPNCWSQLDPVSQTSIRITLPFYQEGGLTASPYGGIPLPRTRIATAHIQALSLPVFILYEPFRNLFWSLPSPFSCFDNPILSAGPGRMR